MHFSEDPRAIPLWINGRACLRLTPAFVEVRNPIAGTVLKKIPVCGTNDVEEAILSAQAVLPVWSGLGESVRRQLLSSLGDAAEALAEHFMKLVAEEAGMSAEQARPVVEAIVEHLRSPEAHSREGVAVVASESASGIAGITGLAAAVLAAGGGVIVCPPLQAPSALLALAELSGRCGFPAGAISVVYPGSGVLAGLRGQPGLTILSC
ncbi:aldehyde dehydrogenase family protein [Propionivibrio sp.]|uniref:aldehyde dehydrogenase family protein n=1 Tax=Propionivibrio sp. TaxID=2212460 RepID=UPI00272E8752|nr:aldehyde dehydrogenase family protein [Propionivibrio sp.]